MGSSFRVGNKLFFLNQQRLCPAVTFTFLLKSPASKHVSSCWMNLLFYLSGTPSLSVYCKLKKFHSAFCSVDVISNRLLNEPQMNFCSSSTLLNLPKDCSTLCFMLNDACCSILNQSINILHKNKMRYHGSSTSPITCFLVQPAFLHIWIYLPYHWRMVCSWNFCFTSFIIRFLR